MTRSEKANQIAELKNKFEKYPFFYLTDSSTLSVDKINQLRRVCFEKGVEMRVVKNTLALKALQDAPEEMGYASLYDSLKGPTAIMFTDVANAPAKILEDFRKDNDKPELKAAYIETDVFVGDDQIKALASLKSKEDLIGEVILLLQSPIKTVMASLDSGKNTLSGLIKALENRGE